MVCEATIVLNFSFFEKMDPKRELAASPTFRSIIETVRDYYFKTGKQQKFLDVRLHKLALSAKS